MVYVDFEYFPLNEPLEDWQKEQLEDVVNSLCCDGVGLLPTDSANAYAASLTSREGIRKIYGLKGYDPAARKPLSLLCADMRQAGIYADLGGLPRSWFRAMKSVLPGPFTFIVQATKEVPKVLIKHQSRKKYWKRKEVGIRIPDSSVIQHLATEIGEPLLATSACEGAATAMDVERNTLEFVVAGMSPYEGMEESERSSTIIDLTYEEPVLVREGLGDSKFFYDNI